MAIDRGTAAVDALTARWASTLDGSQTVLSGAGVYLLLALLAPYAAGQVRDDLLAVAPEPIGTSPTEPWLSDSPTTRLAVGVWSMAEVPLTEAWTAAVPHRLRGVLTGRPEVDRTVLDAWAAEQTGGLIPRMPVTLDGSTLMVLASALSVQTSWRERFSDGVRYSAHGPWAERRLAGLARTTFDLSVLRVFDTSAGPLTMFTVVGEDDVDVLLALGEPDRAAADVLPAAITALSGAPELPVEAGPGVQAKVVPDYDDTPELIVSTVRFSVAGSHNLLAHAEVFGLTAATDPSVGHFPGISPVPLGVSQARQDALAIFTAEGFKAAAITTFEMWPTSAMPPPKTFQKRQVRADFGHPFGFVAVHRPTGLVLVTGWIADPEPYTD